MIYVFVIFFGGLIVSLLVAKGVLQANEFARSEMDRERESQSSTGDQP
jgi:hypothetical protein